MGRRTVKDKVQGEVKGNAQDKYPGKMADFFTSTISQLQKTIDKNLGIEEAQAKEAMGVCIYHPENQHARLEEPR